MRWGRGIRRLFHLGLWGPEVDEGVEWEIEHHIEERADELEAEGLSRAEALAEARRSFGDVEAVRRELRAMDRERDRRNRMVVWLETVGQDLGYGLRGLGRNPGFAAALVLTLGLGIGATVAVFAIVDALLLRPLPYASSEELARVDLERPDGFALRFLPAELVEDWSRESSLFDDMLPNLRGDALLTGGGSPERVAAHRVAPTFEEVLGVRPFLGRGLVAGDARAGGPVLMSHGYWRRAFGADPGVVGSTVRLDGEPRTVVGVMPRGFKFPAYSETEFWVPLTSDVTSPGRLELLVRVPGGDMERAAARVNTSARGRLEGPGLDSASLRLTPLEAERGGGPDLRRAVWLLFGAVGLIFLVAATNGSNLLLVRGTSRARELAVRAAVGASRGRMVRQLMTETVALALLAGVVAVGVAFLALRAAGGLLPEELLFWLPHEVAVERRALVFAFGLTTVTALVLGLLPALRTTARARARARDGLTPYAAHGTGRSRLRRVLVVGEVAISVVLLAGGALLLNSFLRLTAIDIGVRTERVGFVHLALEETAGPDSAQSGGFLRRLEERVDGMPGVEAATVTGYLPSSWISFGTALQAEGRPPAGGDPDILPVAHVSPGFFDVLSPRLLAGRSFTTGDRSDEVAIVDEQLARHLWPDDDPVGHRFRIDEGRPWLTVVGVVSDLQLNRRDDRMGDFELLVPFDAEQATTGYVTLAFRSSGDDPSALFPAIRTALRELAPRQPIQETIEADAAYAETIQLPRFLAVLVTALAAVGLALAALGLFGVLAYEIAQRRREMGIRMSLGAGAARIRRMVVLEGMGLAALGSVFGLALALLLTRSLRGLLYDLEPDDPVTLAVVVALMFCVAGLAAYLPARRATRVAPAEVLRAD
jgi:predicted permease